MQVFCSVQQRVTHLKVTAIGVDEGVVGMDIWMQASLGGELVHFARPV